MIETAGLAAAPVSRLRVWLRYDEGLEKPVDAAFEEFIRRSNIGPLFVCGFIASMACAVVFLGVFHPSPSQYARVAAIFYALLYGPSLIGILRVPPQTLSTVFWGAADKWRTVGFSAAISIAAFGMEMLGSALISFMHLQTYERSLLSSSIIVALFGGVFAAPVVEEAFFQGFVQTRLEQRYGGRSAGATTLLFVLYHFPRGLSQYVRGFGLYANAFLRRETRSLGGPAIAHAVNNAIAVGLLVAARTFLHQPMHW